MKMQIKLLPILLVFTMLFGFTAYGSSPGQSTPANKAKHSSEGKVNVLAASPAAKDAGTLSEQSGKKDGINGIRIKITADGQEMTATLIDNATSRNLVDKFPLTVQMMNAHSIEMVYRFPEPLPANEVTTSGYEVGDLYYWTPRNAFVIYYKQNGGVFENLQKVGHVDSGVEIFEKINEATVTFELLDK